MQVTTSPYYITANDFRQSMLKLTSGEDITSFAVGVSGGADSMALCLLAAQYAKEFGVKLVALTVNHGLRPEAANEAEQVAKWLFEKGIEHHILCWEGEKPTSKIEETARKARYDLLLSFCRQKGIGHLLLAHNKNDQAETFMIRLAAKSGVDGLACMAGKSVREEIVLLRPLLAFSRARIVATNAFFNQKWVEDPSNQYDGYARVRWRKFMPQLKSLGIDEDVIALAAEKQAKVRAFMDWETANFMRKAVKVSSFGYAETDYEQWLDTHEEIAFRVMQKLLLCLGDNEYLPRSKSVSLLIEKLKNNSMGGGITIAGCKVMLKKKKVILITREEKKADIRVPIDSSEIKWDRFTVILPRESLPALKNAYIAPLGRGHKIKAKTPYPVVLVTLPAIFDKDGLLLVPHLGYKRENTAITECKVDFTPLYSLAGPVNI